MVYEIHSIRGVDAKNANAREFIWKEGLAVIKNHWFIGTGTGDVTDALVDRYSDLILARPTTDNLVDSIVLNIQKASSLKEAALQANNIFASQLGDSKSVLERKNNVYKNAFKRKYNFHNQYLQIFGEVGIFGFLLLCFILGSPFLISLRNKDYLAISFLFIIAASFLTESMLEREAGVSFYAFFYVLVIENITQNKLS